MLVGSQAYSEIICFFIQHLKFYLEYIDFLKVYCMPTYRPTNIRILERLEEKR